LCLPDGILVQRYPHDELCLSKPSKRSAERAAEYKTDAIPLYKVAFPRSDLGTRLEQIKDLNITLTCQHMHPDSIGDPTYTGQNTAFFDMDQLTSPLGLRPILPGDRFRPLGMTGTQKVKDFLINNKIPREKRRRILVLLNQNRIIWILGHRIDDGVKITQQTRNVLKIKINKHR